MTSSAPTLGRSLQWGFTCSGTFAVKGIMSRFCSLCVPMPGSCWIQEIGRPFLAVLLRWLPLLHIYIFIKKYTFCPGPIIFYWLYSESVESCGCGEVVTLWCSFFFSAMDNLQERALHIRKVLLNLPKTTLIVMRYLFAFLNQWVSFRAPWPCCV